MARGVEHRDRAGQIGAMRPQPIAIAEFDRSDRRQMETAIDTLHRLGHGCGIGDIADKQRCRRIEIVPLAGRQIVQHPHRVAPGQQGIDQMRPDKTAPACHEIKRHYPKAPVRHSREGGNPAYVAILS